MSPEQHRKLKARLHRQIAVLRGRNARLDRFLDWIEDDRTRIYRVPLAVLLILGGLLSFLPVLGLWMLPLGILLLALDLPLLRGPVTLATIRFRRRMGRWLHRRSKLNSTR
ncbi:MAG: hypothetical protein H3C51_10425 [Rubellimicrobium sp.]|nr:hypothetical protein [Rubellimicrobium sp.]